MDKIEQQFIEHAQNLGCEVDSSATMPMADIFDDKNGFARFIFRPRKVELFIIIRGKGPKKELGTLLSMQQFFALTQQDVEQIANTIKQQRDEYFSAIQTAYQAISQLKQDLKQMF